ncbi:hypothetical protein DFH08DRAFT_717092, partial [Mycena albidolilacea]
PKWMRDGAKLLQGCPEGGSEWKEAVANWTALEETYGLKSSSANLPSPGKVRPEEVHQWLKNARSTTKKVIVKSHEMLVKDWWNWWSALAPAWREKDGVGRPKIGEENGEWGDLIHPGANGLLMVLLPLVWWREGEPGNAAGEDWLSAVRDVSWVLERLLSAAKAKYVHSLSPTL